MVAYLGVVARRPDDRVVLVAEHGLKYPLSGSAIWPGESNREGWYSWGDDSADTHGIAWTMLSHSLGGNDSVAMSLVTRFVSEILGKLSRRRSFRLEQWQVERWLRAQAVAPPERRSYKYLGEFDERGRARLWFQPGATPRYEVPHVAQHSPTGLSWGYQGPGQVDTALSILSHATGYAACGLRDLYPVGELLWNPGDERTGAFSRQVLARLGIAQPFVLDHADVEVWIRKREPYQGGPATLYDLAAGLPAHIVRRLGQDDRQHQVLSPLLPTPPEPAGPEVAG